MDNHREGRGAILYPSGAIRDGWFKADLQEGLGSHIKADNDYEYGQYRDGQLHGIGTKSMPDGSKYIGEF